MWHDRIYTKAQAKYKFSQIEADPDNCTPTQVSAPLEKLREMLVNEREKFLIDEQHKVQSHSYDLQMGLLLYQVLNDDYQFNERLATQDEIWRYLSLEIVPDLVYERYGMNDLRFYKSSRRIWLRNLWWYIHLSWQGSEQETYDVLKGNSSDEFLQLTDRVGSGGYRVELSRELMKQNSIHPGIFLFRKVLKLNTARLNLIEPSLVEGGIKKYVEDLYRYFLD